jgi:hypothetical protein
LLVREITAKSSLTISAKQVGAWGCVSAVDSSGRTIWIADAHRGDGKRFVVRADELLTAFLELESAIRGSFFGYGSAVPGSSQSSNR